MSRIRLLSKWQINLNCVKLNSDLMMVEMICCTRPLVERVAVHAN